MARETFHIDIDGERITRDKLNIGICTLISLRSTCARAKVGCVIVRTHRVIATGYNGKLGDSPCSMVCDKNSKCKHAIHAEKNAINFAARHGIALEGSELFCTYCPCYECAKDIIQAGIVRVVFEKGYATDNGEGLKLLKDNQIDVTKVCLIEY